MKTFRVTAQNIDSLSYHNLCKVTDSTHFANPFAAAQELGCTWTFEVDDQGNFLRLVNDEPTEQELIQDILEGGWRFK